MADKWDIPPPPAGIVNKWKGALASITYGTEEFRFWYKGDGPRESIDGWVESMSWDDLADSAPVVTGSVSLRQSRVHAPIPRILIGDQIICEMRLNNGASWKELIRLRVQEPQRTSSGQFTFQLANDAVLLTMGDDDWRFPKNKQHRSGWKPWQVVALVSDRCKVRIVMPKTGKPMKKFPVLKKHSPIDVINAALKHLRDQERKVLIRRFEAGTLYISERHYSPELMTLGPQIIEASLVETRRDAWATTLTVRGVAEKSKGKTSKGTKKATHKAITVQVTRPQFVKRYGYVHRIVYAHGADSIAEARAMGLAHLARVLIPKKTLSLTTPFIPGLRRGAYIRLALEELGLTQIVYVQSMSYQLSAGSAVMDLTLAFEDPQVTPAVDKVNASSRGTTVTARKTTNPKPDGSKTDAQTAKPPKKTVSVGGVTSV